VRPSARDALLSLCARAYPKAARERDGDALLDLASELAEDRSSTLREAAGLVRSGASARIRGLAGRIALVPLRAARERLALPLAAALFALAAVGAARAGLAQGWVGWSVVVLLGAAGLTIAGAAAGHRWLTAAGAFAVSGMLGLDALRDTYGAGSRWGSEVGSALVDVLVMWLPAGLLMLLCAGAVRRVPASVGISRVAWAVLPGTALLVLASEPTRLVIAERIVLFGGFAAAVILVVLAFVRRRTDPVLPLVAALVLAAVAGPALWLVAIFLPPPAGGTPPVGLAYFAAGGVMTAAAVAALARISANSR
jgi:hypothetical protein